MTKKNITVSVEEDVLRRAKVAAAERGTSLSRMVGEYLSELGKAPRSDTDWSARVKALVKMSNDSGQVSGAPMTDEELYGR